MFLFFPIPKSLDKKVRKALERGEIALNEAMSIKEQVDAHHNNAVKGFKRAVIITASIMLLMVVLSFQQMIKSQVVTIAILFIIGVLAGIFLIVKALYVDLMAKQFMKAVNKGYPNQF